MRHDDIAITGVGVRLGEQVRTPPLVRKGLLTEADANRTRQRSVCVSPNSGSELALHAAEEAVRQHRASAGAVPQIGFHAHATMHNNADSWSTASYILDQLGVTEARTAVDLGTAANGVLALDLVATIVGARSDITNALVSCGDQFGNPRFRRYSADHDVLFGDAGAALVLGRTTDEVPGVANLLATADHTDPSLEGLSHGLPPVTAALGRDGESVDIRAWKQAWVDANGGAEETVRRHTSAVTQVVKAVLADAELDLDDIRWVLCPFGGYESVEQLWLNPIGIDDHRTLTLLGLHFGHLGTSDQIVGLYHLLVTGSVEPGDHLLLIASGAGKTWTAAVVQITADSSTWRRVTSHAATPSSMGDR